MKDLSRLQFVAIGLVHDSELFTSEDLAHLNNCTFDLQYTTRGERALIATFVIEFRNWSYLNHREAQSDAERMPAEIQIAFEQDIVGKLTGKIESGFIAEEPVLIRQLDYLKGW